MSDNVIEIEHLTKTYRLYNSNRDRLKEAMSISGKRYSRDFNALQDVSFEVKRGETIGIIGRNGAGKSTLLKILTGVLTPTKGKAIVKGKVAALLELGAGFNPEMTGRENIYFNGTIMGFSEKEMDAKADDIIKFADIGDFIDQPVRMYSSGMFARLAFAVNANVNPDILIVDEALAVGDVFFQNKCFRKFADLRKRGTTIVFVSHDMGSVKQLCSRVVWLTNGKVKMIGDREKICELYFNEEIKERNKEAQYSEITTNSFDVKTENNNNKKRIVNVEPKSIDMLSDKAKISSFDIITEQKEGTIVLIAKNKYTLLIGLDFFKDVNHCILGFTVINRKGISIIGTNTFSVGKGKTFNACHGEHIDVSFSFVMPSILPDEYVIDTALASGEQAEHIILTWLHGARTIQVINEESNKLGLIDLTCTVDINK